MVTTTAVSSFLNLFETSLVAWTEMRASTQNLKWNLHYTTAILVFWICILTGCCCALKELPTKLDDPLIGSEKGAIHVITSSECKRNYLTFQEWAQKYTFDLVNQPGNYTRIWSCENPDIVTEEDVEVIDTLVVPNWELHPTTGDRYAPYNKPVGFIYWLAERKPTAEWTLVVDPDMLFRHPFLVKDFEVPEGYAVSSGYNYLRGAYNELAERHVPNVVPRNDKYGGPKGRKADISGAFYFIRTKDLAKMAFLYLNFTEAVRWDPLAWNLTGDEFTKKGDKPWISEMYGYMYAAATAGIWHKIDDTVQSYAGYDIVDSPILVHYGLNHTVMNYWFDKHVHYNFDATKCPPWKMDFNRKQDDDGGLFPHPPFPNELLTISPRKRYGELMVIEVVNTINQALCQRHKRKCNESEQLIKECGKVDEISKALVKEFEELQTEDKICHDNDLRCKSWAEESGCESEWLYMMKECRISCKKCRAQTYGRPTSKDGEDDSLREVAKTEDKERKDEDTVDKERKDEDIVDKERKDEDTVDEDRNDEYIAGKDVVGGDNMEHIVVEEIETNAEDKVAVQIEDVSTKATHEAAINSKEDEKELDEIVRCESMSTSSFFKDSKCIELLKGGLIQRHRPRMFRAASGRNQNRQRPSGIEFYGLFVVVGVVLGVVYASKRLFSITKRKTAVKRL